MNNPYEWTYSGMAVDLIDPKPEQFNWKDISSGLSKICRFAGQINVHYSVADHCVNLVEYIQDHKPELASSEFLMTALFHDAAEAYTSDIPSPVKQCVKGFKELETKLQEQIFYKFKIPTISSELKSLLNFYDKAIVHDEGYQLFTYVPAWYDHTRELGIPIKISNNFLAAECRFIDKIMEICDNENPFG